MSRNLINNVLLENTNNLVSQLGENDTFVGSEGDDTLNAGTGVDYIDGGDGNDTIFLDYSTLKVGIEHDGYAENYGVTLSIDNYQDIHHHENIEQVNLKGTNFDDTISGSGLNDSLDGSSGRDVLSLGFFKQMDSLEIVVDFSNTSNQVSGIGKLEVKNFEKIGVLATGSNNDTISITNTDVNFGSIDGGEGIDVLTVDFSQLKQGINGLDIVDVESINIIGTKFDDTLSGSNLIDTLDGGTGHDLLDFDLSSRTDDLNIKVKLNWNNFENQIDINDSPINISNFEIDSLTGGQGNDTITLNYSTLNGGIDYYTVNTKDLVKRSDIEHFDISSVYSLSTEQEIHHHENIENVSITGTNFDDTLVGGVGNDTLNGGANNDTYVLNQNFGSDIIYDDSGDSDRVEFGIGITLDNLSWSFNGKDLIFSLGDSSNEQLIIKNYLNLDHQIESFIVDGNKLTKTEIVSKDAQNTVNKNILVSSATGRTILLSATTVALLGLFFFLKIFSKGN